eukprot:6632962-Pyramimonas_sp.AAC.1
MARGCLLAQDRLEAEDVLKYEGRPEAEAVLEYEGRQEAEAVLKDGDEGCAWEDGGESGGGPRPRALRGASAWAKPTQGRKPTSTTVDKRPGGDEA